MNYSPINLTLKKVKLEKNYLGEGQKAGKGWNLMLFRLGQCTCKTPSLNNLPSNLYFGICMVLTLGRQIREIRMSFISATKRSRYPSPFQFRLLKKENSSGSVKLQIGEDTVLTSVLKTGLKIALLTCS